MSAKPSSVCILGAGPIRIGQACEFDYSGVQGVRALREEGCRVILVNSNPATVMTDARLAHRSYVEPLTAKTVTAVLEKERPDALIPTLGGQTALNLAVKLEETGGARAARRSPSRRFGALDPACRGSREVSPRDGGGGSAGAARRYGYVVGGGAGRSRDHRSAGNSPTLLHPRRLGRRHGARPGRLRTPAQAGARGFAPRTRCWWKPRCWVGRSTSSR